MISIGHLMDADDIVAEIRMERQSFAGAFMLVEGVTDIRRFEQFTDLPAVSMVNCWGRAKLLGSVKKLNEAKFHGFVALADADFDRLTGVIADLDNLIYSENHDFEIDVIRTDVFSRYLREVAEEDLCEKVGGFDAVSKQIADGLRPLSAAKLANAKGLINVKFPDVNWLPAFDGFQINAERLAYIILKKSNPGREQIDAFLGIVDAEKSAEIWQATNGHDFAEALGACLRLCIAKRKHPQTTGDEVERHLRLALSETDFRSMGVYERILEWQANSKLPILKVHSLH